MLFTDQTGKFPVQSRSGKNYLFVLCDYDENAILAELRPNRKTETLKENTLKLLAQVMKKGYKPNNMRLDNEVSEEHLNMLEEQVLTVKLVPPCNHRQNLAERAMQT